MWLVGCTPTTPAPTPTPIPNKSGTINLHVIILDADGQPVEASIQISWTDTEGSFTIGPTDSIVLPLPADGALFEILITAPGYQDWDTTMTLLKPQSLIVTLEKDRKAPQT